LPGTASLIGYAGILAATIVGGFDSDVSVRIKAYKLHLETEVLKKVDTLKAQGWRNEFDGE